MIFTELDSKDFRKFEQKNPFGNLYQMSERAIVRESMGWNAKLLGVTESDKILAGCLALSRGGVMMVQMGGVMDWSDLKLVKFWLNGLVEYAKSTSNFELSVYPPLKLSIRDKSGEVLEEFDQKKIFALFEAAGFKYLGKTIAVDHKANRWVTVKDLSEFKTVDEMRASYKKNVRNKLRKHAPELEIVEVIDDKDLDEVAFAIEGSNEKNRAKSRDHSYYRYIRDAYGDQVHFVLARRKEDGATVAGRVIFDHPNETISFISGTVQQYRQMNAMTVLQDDLLTKCFNKGIKRVNFYGMAGDFSPANHLLEFKSGFGIKVEEYIGGFKMILKPGKYYRKQLTSGVRRAAGKAKRLIKK